MNKKLVIALSLASTLAACAEIPREAHFTRGQPESLLNVASEQVTIDLRQRNAFIQLADAVSKNQPSNATVTCSSKLICDRAVEVLNQYGVPYDQSTGSVNTVTLDYTSVVAKDCENRFITNHINPYNMNHPTFGCSISINQVQMVSDKRQFVDPMLLGNYDGEKATQNYDTYLSRDPVPLEAIATSGSGGGSQ